MKRYVRGPLVAIVVVSSGLLAFGQEDNQNRLIRVKPSATAARIGTAVHWVDDWETALKTSRQSGKPIFWYVPTVPGTFTDRKIEINRYLLSRPLFLAADHRRAQRKLRPVQNATNRRSSGEIRSQTL